MPTPSTKSLAMLGVTDYYNIAQGRRGDENVMLEYLWQFKREKSDEWSLRSQRTVYNNLTGKALKILVGYTMDGYRAHDAEWKPAPIVPFTADAAWHAFVGGFAWILTLKDGPRLYNAMEVKADKERPGTYVIAAGDRRQVIEFPAEYVRRLGNLPADIPGRVLTQVQTSSGWVDEIEPYDILSDQWVRVQYGVTCQSVIATAAEQAIKCYNYESLKDAGNYRILFCFEYGPRPLNKTEDGLLMGGDYLEMDDKAIVPGVVHGGSVEVMAHAEMVCDREAVKLGAALGLSREFSDEQNLTSGKSKSFDLLDIKSFVGLAAYQISRAVNMAYAADARERGYSPKEASHIALPGDLKPADPALDLAVIEQACRFINSDAAWEESQVEVAKLSLARLLPADKLQAVEDSIRKNGGRRRPWVEGFGSGDTSSVSEGRDETDDMEDKDEPAETEGGDAAPPGGAAETAAVQAVALNGAQVTAAKEISTDYAAGNIPRSAALAMLEIFFGLDTASAARILGPGPEMYPKNSLDTTPQVT